MSEERAEYRTSEMGDQRPAPACDEQPDDSFLEWMPRKPTGDPRRAHVTDKRQQRPVGPREQRPQ